MKIAFDAKRLFNNNTGLGNYSRTLVENLKSEFPDVECQLFAPNVSKSAHSYEFADFPLVDPRPMVSAAWRSYFISRDINNAKPDIYHGLSNEIPFSSKGIKAAKLVTIHDLFYEKYPEDFSRIDRAIYRKKTEFACRNADHVIAISEATKKDIIEIIGIPESKISVVYQSCNNSFQIADKDNEKLKPSSSNMSQLPSEYCLFVGSLNKRKNVVGLIEALAMVPKTDQIPLVIVGQGNSKFMDSLTELIRSHKLEEKVIFMGNLPNTDLIQLYRNARVTVLPSFYEGFGIPIIESLFLGTPVITSNTSSMPEAVGDCGATIDPFSNQELSAMLQLFFQDDTKLYSCKENISAHIEKFSKSLTSNALYELYTRFVIE